MRFQDGPTFKIPMSAQKSQTAVIARVDPKTKTIYVEAKK